MSVAEPKTQKRRPYGAAFIIAGALGALGGLLIWQGFALPDKGGYAGIGSGAMPKVIGAGLFVLALGHVWAGLRERHLPHLHQNNAALGWIIGGLAVQLILLKPVGFSIASGILFAFTARAFGARALHYSLPFGMVFALIVYGVFDQLLKLNLPAGVIETLLFGG